MTLSKEQILSASDLARETVDVPEWGGSVIVQGLSAAQSEQLMKVAKDNPDEFGFNLLALSLIDEQGVLLFNVNDVMSLKAKSTAVLSRLIKACNRINLFDREEAIKNSPPSDAASSE